MAAIQSFVPAAMVRLWGGPHAERARQDAELLLLHVLANDRAWLVTHGNEELSSEKAARFAQLVDRRIRGEPIQYIVGQQEFYGLPFRVSPDVLIPRPETEHLVEKALELAAGFERPRILDVGTGSGAIAIALAHKLRDARTTATDVSAAALNVARENARRNEVAERIRFLAGGLLEPVAGESFDLIVSNPPYVPEKDRGSLSVEVRDHEPALALFAGQDGLDIYRKLIPAAWTSLATGGFLVMEIGFGQTEAVRDLLGKSGFDEIEFTSDLQGLPRVVQARRG